MPAADTPSSPALTASAAEVPDRLTHLLLVREIEEFLFHEANLLDGRQFSAWLDLLTEDIRYFMPLRRNVRHSDQASADTREGKDINWFDEDKFTLQQRVRQIETGVHWAEEPLSRTTHMVSNVTIAEAGTGHGEIQVDLRFLLYRNRLESETDIFVGKRKDTLRRSGTGWKIARRWIVLDQSVLMAKNLTAFF